MIGRVAACQIVGVSLTTWKRWQQAGHVRWAGRNGGPVPRPTGPRARYARADIDPLADEVLQLGEPFPDPDRPNCYRVPLVGYTCDRFALVDADALPSVAGKRWAWTDRSDNYGGAVILSRFRGPCITLRRVVLGLESADAKVAHANGDPLDCRRANLIVRTCSQKLANARKMGSVSGRQCTSPFKGVTWDRKRACWIGRIARAGEYKYLGRFEDELAAAQAYDDAAREWYADHARVNFPNGIDAFLSNQAEAA
ncbi:MAG TPA: hypothetical protein VEA69_07365 [Tepidisphaeraceae bacterium]|nr:hypothetical protein [Tepidisphaeraceae bacterium]